jgi:hypothetical protein
MNNLPHEDQVSIKALTGELKLLKDDLSNPLVYNEVGEAQLLLWVEEIESIKKVINTILRNARGD